MTRPLVRIIVADRFPIVRRGVRLLIEDLDSFRVVGEAASGREAHRIALETIPNIIVLDLCLPELNALELIHQIRRTGLQTEFLIYTDRYRENSVYEALRAGVKGFVLKSDSSHSLTSAISALSNRLPYLSDEISQRLLSRLNQNKHEQNEAGLTFREREIIQLIAEGCTNKQISLSLDISVKTVETHRANLMRKLHLRTTADLVRYAVRNGVIHA